MSKVLLKIFLLSVLPFVVACSDNEEAKLKGTFIAGCMKPGVPKDICSCVYDKLESKYSFEELKEMNSSNVPSRAFLMELEKGVNKCK